MQDKKKIIIYKSSGGLAHNLKGLSLAIHIALQQNRILIIDMQTNTAFKYPFSTFFSINEPMLKYYDNYDEIINVNYKGKDINEIKNTKLIYKHKKYFLLNEDVRLDYDELKNKIDHELIIYAGNGTSQIKLNLNITINTDIYNELKKETVIKKDYISIHFRNTDIKKRNDINLFINKLLDIIKQYKLNTIYLATDDYYAYDEIKLNFPNVDIIMNTTPNKNGTNLHYNSKDKYKQMYDCIRDIYFILNSTYFIPSMNSSMSKNIIHMIKNKKTIIPNLISKTMVWK